MINYIEKGVGLHEAIGVAGHTFYWENGTAKSTNDIEVQAIIDSYDPLGYERAAAKKRVTSQVNAASKELEDSYPEIEKRTFPYQRKEVEAYLIDNNSPTPTLDTIALKRGKTRIEQITRVSEKIAQYDLLVNNIVGERQRLDDLINIENDFKIIQNISFEL